MIASVLAFVALGIAVFSACLIVWAAGNAQAYDKGYRDGRRDR